MPKKNRARRNKGCTTTPKEDCTTRPKEDCTTRPKEGCTTRPGKNCTTRPEQQSPELMPKYQIAPYGVVGKSDEVRRLREAYEQLTDLDKIIRIPPSGCLAKLDAHVWLVVNGVIHDPSKKAGLLKYMRLVAQQHGFPEPGELVYKEFEGELKQKVWRRIWKLIIKKEIERQEEIGVNKETLFFTVAQKPQPFQCALNAWARHVVLTEGGFKTRVCIGSLGIPLADGRVFWEYG